MKARNRAVKWLTGMLAGLFIILGASSCLAKIELGLSPQIGATYVPATPSDTKFYIAGSARFLKIGQFRSALTFTKKDYGISFNRALNDVLPIKNLEAGVFAARIFSKRDFHLGILLTLDL